MSTNLPRVEAGHVTIRRKGKPRRVPAAVLENRLIVAEGNWLRLATVHDEVFLDQPPLQDPQALAAELRRLRLPADVFAFSEPVPITEVRFPIHHEWDNFAVIRLTSYQQWFEKELPQETRKHIRKAAKKGLVVRKVELDDWFVQGVVDIYNETPIRQGKPFPKYGQDFATVQQALQLNLDRSEFIAAELDGDFVGFVKLIHMGPVASVLGINSKNACFHLKPTNALIAKVVELACDAEKEYLVYGRYIYGRKSNSSLTEFKRRNGFRMMKVARYYLPLTIWGAVVVRLRLYRKPLDLLPAGILDRLERLRTWYFTRRSGRATA